MYRKLMIVPSAGGDAAQPAVRRALMLADASGADIEIFDPVYEPQLEACRGNREVYEPLRRRLVDERRDAAAALAAAIADGRRNVTADAVWAHPLDRAVIERAGARGAELVVTEPLRGRRGAMSHADWRLVSVCPVPVLYVRSDADRAYEHIAAAVDPSHGHAKPADLDAEILSRGHALQSALNARLAVVHCFMPITELALVAAADDLPLHDAERALGEARRHAVDALAAEAGLDASAVRLVAGRPAAVLGKMLESGEADLVILGALSRGRFRDLIVGSTAERLLEHGTGDLLLLKPPGFTSGGA